MPIWAFNPGLSGFKAVIFSITSWYLTRNHLRAQPKLAPWTLDPFPNWHSSEWDIFPPRTLGIVTMMKLTIRKRELYFTGVSWKHGYRKDATQMIWRSSFSSKKRLDNIILVISCLLILLTFLFLNKVLLCVFVYVQKHVYSTHTYASNWALSKHRVSVLCAEF